MLVVEANLDWAMPDTETIFRGTSDDPVERQQRLDDALSEMMTANKPALRMMLAQSLQASANTDDYPGRQNRRTAWIEAALADQT